MRTQLIAGCFVVAAGTTAAPACSGDPVSDLTGGRISTGDVVDPFRTLRTLNNVVRDPKLGQAVVNLAQLKGNIPDEMQTAVAGVLNSGNKAVAADAADLAKQANEIVDATNSVARYAQREIASYPETLSKAQQRLREGKVADAIWHLSTDNLQATNKNMAQAAEESEIVAAAGQAVATAYGGPAGAAAYAAWLSYNETNGNVDQALAAGAYAYVVASGNAKIGDMPSGTITEAAKKAAMAGSVGGLAVAASGGNTQQAINAFINSGGAVLVQAGQSYVKQSYVSDGPSSMDQYCTTAIGQSCAKAQEWYKNAKAQVDGLNQAKETLATLKMTGDRNWAISWNKKAIDQSKARVPAVALTYIGDGSPFKNTINDLAVLADPDKYSRSWVAFRDVGASDTFFTYADPKRSGPPPHVGDVVTANRDVHIRFDAARWKDTNGVLPRGSRIRIVQVKTLQGAGKPQEWVRFERVYANMQ